MSGIRPYLRAVLDTCHPNPRSICSLLLHSLTMSHFPSEVPMNLLYSSFNVIGIMMLAVSSLNCSFPECHPGVRTLKCKESAALLCVWCHIFCSKLIHWEPVYRITLLVVIKHPPVLFHTHINPVCQAIHLGVKGCWHCWFNPQAVTYLAP